MTVPKKYFHDRAILLLLSTNVGLCVLSVIWILFNISNNNSNGYIVQYRGNLGLNAFKSGGVGTFLSFMIFAVFTAAFNSVLSVRVFHVRKGLAVGVLAMSILLITLSIIVSNALLLNNH